MIISLYAGGMTVRDIQHHLATALRVDVSHEAISAVTDAVLDEVLVWQNRLLDEFYPVIFRDVLRVKIRDGGRVVNKSAYLAIGVDLDRIKHVLGMWIAIEGYRRRGLPGGCRYVHTCIVHLICVANRWVAYGDRRAVSAALKKGLYRP